MLRGEIAGREVRLAGCETLSFAPRFAAFPSSGRSPDFYMTVDVVPELVIPFGKPLGQYRRTRWMQLGDGRYLLYAAAQTDTPFALTFDDAFSQPVLTVTPTAAEQAATLQYLYVSQCFAYHLLTGGGCVLHSAGLSLNGSGVALCGPSGIGKSTLARVWQTENSAVSNLNDDSPAVLWQDGRFVLAGTPFCGDGTAYQNGTAPLKAIVLLEQAAYNRLEKLPVRDALFGVLSCLPRPVYHERLCTVATDLAVQLTQTVPVYRLYGDATAQTAALLDELCHRI